MPMATREGLFEAVFSVESAPRVYNEDTSQAAVSCQQFSWVKWREVTGWWVRGFSCQLQVSLRREGWRLVWNGRQLGPQSVECWVGCSGEWSEVKRSEVKWSEVKQLSFQLRGSFARAADRWKPKYLHCVKSVARKRLVEALIDWGH
jgi:hypothetical protein